MLRLRGTLPQVAVAATEKSIALSVLPFFDFSGFFPSKRLDITNTKDSWSLPDQKKLKGRSLQWILAAKLQTADLNFAVEFWVDFLLLAFFCKENPKGYQNGWCSKRQVFRYLRLDILVSACFGTRLAVCLAAKKRGVKTEGDQNSKFSSF